MTVKEFYNWLRMVFPKGEFQLNVDATLTFTPASQSSFLGIGTPQFHEEKATKKARYRLTLSQNYFDKDEQDQTFEAPSLEVLRAVLEATYSSSVEQTCKELESL